jgi:hypothetical protein
MGAQPIPKSSAPGQHSAEFVVLVDEKMAWYADEGAELELDEAGLQARASCPHRASSATARDDVEEDEPKAGLGLDHLRTALGPRLFLAASGLRFGQEAGHGALVTVER